MAVTHEVVEVGSESPVQVGPTGNHAGRDVTVQNLSGSDNIYLGAQGVTTTSFGYKLSPNSAWSVELKMGDHIYAISDGTADVAVFMLGLESSD
jgi:hypothetical protein